MMQNRGVSKTTEVGGEVWRCSNENFVNHALQTPANEKTKIDEKGPQRELRHLIYGKFKAWSSESLNFLILNETQQLKVIFSEKELH